jgi:hypothetical protein
MVDKVMVGDRCKATDLITDFWYAVSNRTLRSDYVMDGVTYPRDTGITPIMPMSIARDLRSDVKTSGANTGEGTPIISAGLRKAVASYYAHTAIKEEFPFSNKLKQANVERLDVKCPRKSDWN